MNDLKRPNSSILVPYEDLMELSRAKAYVEAITTILKTEYPDDTCQLLSIKALLGVTDEETDDTQDPSDPTDPGTGDPTDPPTGDPTDPPTP